MRDLNRRNTETVELVLREMNAKLYEGLSVIQSQQATLSSLVERVSRLEQLLNVKNMKLTGLGPSEPANGDQH